VVVGEFGNLSIRGAEHGRQGWIEDVFLAAEVRRQKFLNLEESF
jgi:hypothetical protein